jgi:hypothetical protein
MQHHFPILFENRPEEILRREKNYCAVENIQVITEGELVISYAIGTIRASYSHNLFTKHGF